MIFISCGGDINISLYTRDLSDVMTSREKVLYSKVNMIVEGFEDENDIEFLKCQRDLMHGQKNLLAIFMKKITLVE